MEQLARLPRPGESVTFEGIQLVTEAADRRRVLQVKVVSKGTSPKPREDRNSPRAGGMGAAMALLSASLFLGAGCSAPPPVPRPAGYYRIAMHDTAFRTVELACPLMLDVALAARVEPVQEFAPDSCWFNLVYPRYNARIHCTYGGGVALEPVMEDAFKLAYEHEIKADAIEVRKRDYEKGGVAVTWRIAGNAASPLQFLCTDGEDQFLRGALYFEVRPNGDSLAPITSRLGMDVEHLMANLHWR